MAPTTTNRPITRSRRRRFRAQVPRASCHPQSPPITGHRFYNPDSGRWLNRDPLQEYGGVNLYAVNWNDYINDVDPFGLASCQQLRAMMQSAKNRMNGLLSQFSQAMNQMSTVLNAARLQGALLQGSGVLSLGVVLLAGAPVIGFAGVGSSSCVIGRQSFQLVFRSQSTGAGVGVIGSGTGSSFGTTPLTMGSVGIGVSVSRLVANIADRRLRNQAAAVAQSIQAILDAMDIYKNLMSSIASQANAQGCCLSCR